MKKEVARRKKLDARILNFRIKNFGTKFLLISILFFVISCQDVKKPIPPENLISKDKMTSILVEVYTINAARNVNNKLLNNLGVPLDSIIYEKYNIDSLQFVESNNYYSSNLRVFSEILVDVQEQLIIIEKEKDSIYKLIKLKKGDTINSNKNTSNTLIEPKESRLKDSIQLKSLK